MIGLIVSRSVTTSVTFRLKSDRRVTTARFVNFINENTLNSKILFYFYNFNWIFSIIPFLGFLNVGYFSSFNLSNEPQADDALGRWNEEPRPNACSFLFLRICHVWHLLPQLQTCSWFWHPFLWAFWWWPLVVWKLKNNAQNLVYVHPNFNTKLEIHNTFKLQKN